MEIQVIDKNKHIFRIKNIEYRFVKPNLLYFDFGNFIEGKVKGSTLGWNLNNEFLSYNQLKKTLVNKQNKSTMSKPLNNDPFQPWNNPMNEDDPFAPHNGFDSDNPFKPWNNPLGNSDQLTDQEREGYGLPVRRRDYLEDDY